MALEKAVTEDKIEVVKTIQELEARITALEDA